VKEIIVLDAVPTSAFLGESKSQLIQSVEQKFQIAHVLSTIGVFRLISLVKPDFFFNVPREFSAETDHLVNDPSYYTHSLTLLEQDTIIARYILSTDNHLPLKIPVHVVINEDSQWNSLWKNETIITKDKLSTNLSIQTTKEEESCVQKNPSRAADIILAFISHT